MRTITVDDVLELLEHAVEARGEEYIDPLSIEVDGECSYYATTKKGMTVKDGRAQPGCIVGHVFYELGFDVDKVNRGSVGSCIAHDGTVFNSGVEIRFDPNAVDVLDAAQAAQDRGEPWGMALEKAKAVAW